RKTADLAALNIEHLAAGEPNSVGSDRVSDQGQAAQVDDVVHAGADGDPVDRGAGRDAGFAGPVIGDADRLVDRHQPVAGGVHRGDLAAGIDLGEGKGKAAAGKGVA